MECHNCNISTIPIIQIYFKKYKHKDSFNFNHSESIENKSVKKLIHFKLYKLHLKKLKTKYQNRF